MNTYRLPPIHFGLDLPVLISNKTGSNIERFTNGDTFESVENSLALRRTIFEQFLEKMTLADLEAIDLEDYKNRESLKIAELETVLYNTPEKKLKELWADIFDTEDKIKLFEKNIGYKFYPQGHPEFKNGNTPVLYAAAAPGMGNSASYISKTEELAYSKMNTLEKADYVRFLRAYLVLTYRYNKEELPINSALRETHILKKGPKTGNEIKGSQPTRHWLGLKGINRWRGS